jgi:hypothetical protein
MLMYFLTAELHEWRPPFFETRLEARARHRQERSA